MYKWRLCKVSELKGRMQEMMDAYEAYLAGVYDDGMSMGGRWL
jgi:hypothetical protein